MIYKTKDQHELNYTIWGNLNSSSKVILFFHGFPGSHLQAGGLKKYTDKHNFALVAVDRPGYGKSTYTKPGDFKSHSDGIIELLNSLGIKKFSVIGVSGGAPMAHLISARYPDRIEKLCIVCGLVPYASSSKRLFSTNQKRAMVIRKYTPSVIFKRFADAALMHFGPEKKMQHFLSFLNEADKKTLGAPENRLVILQSMLEARRQKSKGVVWDSALYAQNWINFCEMENFKKFPIDYYHGQEDRLLNYQMSTYMNKLIPHSKISLFETEGHYSLAFDRAEEILCKALT